MHTLILATALLVGMAGCDRDRDARELHVHAAASMQEVVGELEVMFEDAHPGVDVVVHLAGSQQLRTWIEHGAPADVFIAADARHTAALREQGLVHDALEAVACNALVVAVPANNPAKIERFEELPRATRIALGVSEVPVGAYADAVLARADEALGDAFGARVAERVASRELNTRQVLARVRLGEVDAALVYATDALSAPGEVEVIEVPGQFGGQARYPAVTLDDDPLAAEWLDLMTSDVGRELLRTHGFVDCAP